MKIIFVWQKYRITHIRPQVVNTNSKKNTTQGCFFRKNSLSCEKKIKFSFKIKKQSLYRNSKKDSRKSVLNQTHIVGHGKPENRFPAASIQISRSYGIRDRKNERRSKPHIVFIFQKSRRIRFSYAQAARAAT